MEDIIAAPKESRMAKGLWWDEALTLVPGCTKVSAGCDNCWSKARADRFKEEWTARLDLTQMGKKLRPGGSPKIYAVWNDLFHENIEFRHIRSCMIAFSQFKHHGFMVLTKRIHRAMHGMDSWILYNGVPGNTCIGATVENERNTDRIWPLSNIPARRFVSFEPLIGPIYVPQETLEKVDLAIIGCESGASRRECNIEWVRYLVEQCRSAGVKVFIKQLAIGKKVVKNLDDFPEDLRIREWFGEKNNENDS